MSEKKYGTIVTDLGLQAITNATLENRKVNIVQIAVGDGAGTYYNPAPAMTELKHENWRGSVSRVMINEKSNNMIDVIGVIPSDVGGWTIREIGVFDDEGVLIAICNTPDTEKVVISSGAAGEIEITLHIEMTNTDNITFTIDPNVITATKKDLKLHEMSETAHKNLFDAKADRATTENHINNDSIHLSPELKETYNNAVTSIANHIGDNDKHTNTEEKTKWTQGAEQAATAIEEIRRATNELNALKSKVAKVEDGLYNNITGNPFSVLFGDIEGVEIEKGIWNKQKARIEC